MLSSYINKFKFSTLDIIKFIIFVIMDKPTLYIIAGCNGAGKTTASFTILPDILNCNQFINADEIAKGLSPFDPNSVAIEAGRLMLKRIDELLPIKKTFSIETTLATKSYVNLINKAHDLDYKIVLLFFFLDSPELAFQRVSQRVAEGGHDIPTHIIKRRYIAGIKNLFELFIPIVDYWMITDNSNLTSKIIATSDKIYDNEALIKIKNYVRKGEK